jgi:hypothetical protein
VRLARLLESAGLHVISFHGAYSIMTVPPGIRPPAWAARQRMLTDRIIDHGMLRRRETRPQPARHIPVRPTIFAPQFITIGQRTTGTKQPGGCNITKRYPERGYLRAANRVGMSGASHSKSALWWACQLSRRYDVTWDIDDWFARTSPSREVWAPSSSSRPLAWRCTARAGPGYLLSGGFGGADCEGVVGEVGDKVQAPAECLDVAGDGLDG